MKYRVLWATAAAGVALHLAGLGWDVYRHAHDSSLATREDVLSLANPSHLMIIVGMAITAASLLGMAAVWMHDRNLGGQGLPGSLLRSVTLPVIAVAAGGAIWLASNAEDTSHSHAHTDAVAADHPHNPDSSEIVASQASGDTTAAAEHSHPAAAPAASTGAAEDPMGEGNAHTHGTEVPATAEQMIAAGQFAESVKVKTAKYADVRDAMAAGYIQITQDLPGIAAHFIRLDYQHDGHQLDADYPEVLLYTKRLTGSWQLVGAMFLAETQSETPPSYFGPLDVWHRHENLCFLAGSQVRTATGASDCKNGLFVAATAYQMHVWVVPSATGVFSHDLQSISPGTTPAATRPAAEDFRVQAR